MANDCSQRICQFGKAHADTPKGDLDASGGALTGPGVTVIKNDAIYPCGAEESFPNMADSAGDILSNTAHSYFECSNKGICDRSSGTCGCFDGYSGSACQFASCPTNSNGICSGHGTCASAKEIAAKDTSNIYDLWDEYSTLGCVCDPGYDGADCSERTCKYGPDPLYYDDVANARVPNTTYIIYTQSATATVTGTYAVIYTDNTGKPWQTVPISINAECADYTSGGITYVGIISALEGLPNNIIPKGSVRCLKWDNLYTSGVAYAEPLSPNIVAARVYMVAKFTIVLTQNYGDLPPLQLNFFLDGSRATLYSNEVVSTLGSYVFSNGFSGEDTDYVPNLCSGVTVSLNKAATNNYYYLSMGTGQDALLKACLGDADGNSANNVEVYNWDYGSSTNPHLIKLIETTASVPSFIDTKQCHYVPNVSPMNNICVGVLDSGSQTTSSSTTTTACNNFNPPGFYAMLVYENSSFRIYNRAGQDYGFVAQGTGSVQTTFNLFTTTGSLQRVSNYVDAYTSFGGDSDSTGVTFEVPNLITNTVHTILNSAGKNAYPSYDANVDCNVHKAGTLGSLGCVSKGDLVMLMNTDETVVGFQANPVYPQIYTVSKVSKAYPTSDSQTNNQLNTVVLDMPVNAVYNSFRSMSTFTKNAQQDTSAGLFVFTPPANGGESYVSECSGRGICNPTSGLCECFNGYTSDNCAVMDALAI